MPKSESVERFLATGEHDPDFPTWEGGLQHRRREGPQLLARILRRVVRWRSRGAPVSAGVVPPDAEGVIRGRVRPLLSGLFAPSVAETLLQVLPPRVQVVTVDRFENELHDLPLDIQWTLANMLLDEMGAPPVSDTAPQLDGFCFGGRAWVLPRALDVGEGTSDILVHEVAHLLHELSRADVGLLPKAEPLLDIPLPLRETWAYGCELWACAERGESALLTAQERVNQVVAARLLTDSRIDQALLGAVLEQAAAEPARGFAAIRAAIRVRPTLPL
jgi:hypothetical protein